MQTQGGTLLASPVLTFPAMFSAGSIVISYLPLFFVATGATDISREFGLSPSQYGATFSVFLGGQVSAAWSSGPFIDRHGSGVFLRVGMVVVIIASLGLAMFTSTWIALGVFLLLGGGAAGIVQPAANRLLVVGSSPTRLGVAFGLQQTTGPLAALAAGMAYPVVAVLGGWAAAFYLPAVLGLGGMVILALWHRGPWMTEGQRTRARYQGPNGTRYASGLVPLTLAFGLAFAVSSIVIAYYPLSAKDAGSSARVVGVALALASGFAIVVRFGSSAALDRTGWRPLGVCSALMFLGGCGVVLLALPSPLLMAAGFAIGLVGTWGWTGAFWVAVMRRRPEDPGRASSAIAPASLGGVFGPWVFGLAMELFSAAVAWFATASLAFVTAMILGATDWLDMRSGSGP